ncbi:MAG TPA: diaminopimelate decarboxylase [Aggregatilineales bacterium]|nr:diaminopimelate decarboxylase [Anaerolineales bacterium]HRE46758.1 diaminopimelate decarboxylase [Aggregatilineales bacterium]
MIAYHEGVLHAGGVSLAAIASAVGTPCYIYDLDRVGENVRRLQAAFPEAEIHYSLKANANLALIRALVGMGCGLDAVSAGEIFRARRGGARPDQIVFAGVGKTRAELEYAVGMGIGWINVESSGEFRRLAAVAQAAGKHPRVALRLNPDVHADTHSYIDTGHAASKFGIALDEAKAILADESLRTHLDIAGLHIHIGSQVGNATRTAEALQAVLPLFEAHPFLHTLDLGGGFPVAYMGESVPSIETFAEAVRPLLRGRTIHLILEPGRYIAADVGVLLITVQYLKPGGGDVACLAVTDGGMTELIRPALYGATHGVLPLYERQGMADSTLIPTQIVGPVCESADVLRARVALHPLKEGDILAVLHAGAYGAVMGSTYNARPRPPEIVAEGGQWRIARRRETWDDLVALEEGL